MEYRSSFLRGMKVLKDSYPKADIILKEVPYNTKKSTVTVKIYGKDKVWTYDELTALRS